MGTAAIAVSSTGKGWVYGREKCGHLGARIRHSQEGENCHAEVFSAEVQKRIPIPNVCRAFSIDYIDTFTLLKELRFNF